jgi:hypothetical protein
LRNWRTGNEVCQLCLSFFVEQVENLAVVRHCFPAQIPGVGPKAVRA